MVCPLRNSPSSRSFTADRNDILNGNESVNTNINQTGNSNQTFETLVRTSIEEAKIACDINKVLKKFSKKQKALINKARQGKDEYIVAFMKKYKIGNDFQRGEVATAMVEAHESEQQAPKGNCLYYFFPAFSGNFGCFFCILF